jgi:(p)ppGpp synthase/HD superfamily hydrolase
MEGIRVLPVPSTPAYARALTWAEELHRGQRRKGKEVPYISHLIAVSALVWEDGGDEEQAIAALLHDAIEDAGVSAEQISKRFGDRVARIVADCTDTAGPTGPGEQKEPWLVRKRRYLEHLQEVPLDSLLVSATDKAHNARDQMLDSRRDPGFWSEFSTGIDGTAAESRHGFELAWIKGPGWEVHWGSSWSAAWSPRQALRRSFRVAVTWTPATR